MSDFELNQSIHILESLTSDLLKKDDNKPILLYTGCSRSATGFRDDSVEGTLVRLCHPYQIDGISAQLEATHKGTIHYEENNDEGKV